MTLLIAISLLVPFALLTWRRPEVGVGLLAALLPSYVIRFEFGIPFTFLELLILTFFATIALKYRKTCWKSTTRLHRILIELLFMAGAVGLIVAPDVMPALGLWKAYIIEPILVSLALAWIPMSKENLLKPVLLGLGITGAIMGGVAAVQFITGWGIPSPWDAEEFRRAVAWYPYPNALGLFLAPVAAAWMIAGWKGFLGKNGYWLPAAALHAVGIAASVSEGAAIALLGALLVYVYRYRSRSLAVLISLTLLGAGLLTPMLQEVILFQDASGEVRLVLWEGTVRLLQAHPLEGSGLGGFPAMYEMYKEARHVELLLYPHNILLNFWTQFGIMGPLFLVGVFIIVGIPTWRHPSRANAVILTALSAVLIYGLVDVPYFKNDLAVLIWFFLTLALKPEERDILAN